MKFKSPQEKYQFFLENWGNHTNTELAKIMGTSANYISQMARKARKEGIKLVKKNSSHWNGRNNIINWKELRK